MATKTGSKAGSKSQSNSGKSFQITLLRSLIGCTATQKETVRVLGLRKIRQSVTLTDHPATRGQILKVQHLLDVKVV